MPLQRLKIAKEWTLEGAEAQKKADLLIDCIGRGGSVLYLEEKDQESGAVSITMKFTPSSQALQNYPSTMMTPKVLPFHEENFECSVTPQLVVQKSSPKKIFTRHALPPAMRQALIEEFDKVDPPIQPYTRDDVRRNMGEFTPRLDDLLRREEIHSSNWAKYLSEGIGDKEALRRERHCLIKEFETLSMELKEVWDQEQARTTTKRAKKAAEERERYQRKKARRNHNDQTVLG